MDSRNKLISATMPFTKEDRLKSWYYFLSTLFLTCVVFAGTYYIPTVPGKLIAGILAGLLTSRLFVIYHDYHHDAILRHSKLADGMMLVLGLLMLAPVSIWRESHQHHHNHNSKFSRMVIGSFPTLTKDNFINSTRAQRFWYLMLRHPLMILFAYIPIFLVSFCLWPFFENPRKYLDCGLAAVLHVVILWVAYSLGGWSVVLFSVVVPGFLMFAIGAYIFYAQHNFPEVMLMNEHSWDYLDAALHSSSFIKMNHLMHWFTANVGYHHVHHVNSRIPFYRLPEAMKMIPELQHPRSTSLQPGEILRCLKLRLWDEENGRMISLRECYKNGRASLEKAL